MSIKYRYSFLLNFFYESGNSVKATLLLEAEPSASDVQKGQKMQK